MPDGMKDRDIKFSMSGLGDKARDDRNLQNQIDHGSVRLSISQPLQRDPCAQHEIGRLFSLHRSSSAFECAVTAGWNSE